jgi:transposase
MLARRSTGVSATRSSTRTGVASYRIRRASRIATVAARCLLSLSRRSFPFIGRVFADSGYAGEKVAKATLIAVEIVRKKPDQIGFAVHPRRWVVERFFAWIGRNRRLAKDFEATVDSARAFLYAASVMLLDASDRSCFMTFETDS